MIAYLSLLPDYVIIFEVNEIVRISKEWGNPLFSLWYTRILGNEEIASQYLLV